MKIITLFIVLMFCFDGMAARSGKGPRTARPGKSGAAAVKTVDMTSFNIKAGEALGREFRIESAKYDQGSKDVQAARIQALESSLENTTLKGKKAQEIATLIEAMGIAPIARNKMTDIKANNKDADMTKLDEVVQLIDNLPVMIKSKVEETDGPVSDAKMLLLMNTINQHAIKDLDSISILHTKLNDIVPIKTAKDCI